jgi:hypothetical protein
VLLLLLLGGSYERKYYALQLLAVLLAQWKPTSADISISSSSSSADGPTAEASSTPAAAAAASPDPAAVMPLCEGLLSPAAVQVLLGCLVDTWDKLRMAASRCGNSSCCIMLFESEQVHCRCATWYTHALGTACGAQLFVCLHEHWLCVIAVCRMQLGTYRTHVQPLSFQFPTYN